MRQRRGFYSILFFMVLMVFMLNACAMLQPKPDAKPYSEWTPKEKSTFFMASYNKVAEDYKAQVAIPNLTEPMKQVLRTKKAVLTQFWPAIQIYDISIAEGKPDAATEKLILGYLNQLEVKIAK